MSDRLVAEAAALHNTQPRQQTNIHALSGIQTRDTNNLAAAHLRLWPHGHRDRPTVSQEIQNLALFTFVGAY